VRELHEETGYGGDAFEGRIKVVDKSGVIVSDPGMSKVSFELGREEGSRARSEADSVKGGVCRPTWCS